MKSSIIAPDFTQLEINTKEVISLQKYRGKVIILNFWATWCPPCREEIPDMVKIYEGNKSKMVIIGVSLDQNGPDVVRKFYKEYKMNYPVVMGTPKMMSDYQGITAIPTTFIIDKTGNIVKKIIGLRNKAQYEEDLKLYW